MRVYVIGENVDVVVDNDVLAVGIVLVLLDKVASVVVLELLPVRLVKVKDGPALLDAEDVSVEKVVVSSVDFCELRTDVDAVKLVESVLPLVWLDTDAASEVVVVTDAVVVDSSNEAVVVSLVTEISEDVVLSLLVTVSIVVRLVSSLVVNVDGCVVVDITEFSEDIKDIVPVVVCVNSPELVNDGLVCSVTSVVVVS